MGHFAAFHLRPAITIKQILLGIDVSDIKQALKAINVGGEAKGKDGQKTN